MATLWQGSTGSLQRHSPRNRCIYRRYRVTGRETPLSAGAGFSRYRINFSNNWGYRIDPWQLPQILWSQTEGFAVLLHIRFPRVVMAGLVGAVLGLTGATLQGLFQ